MEERQLTSIPVQNCYLFRHPIKKHSLFVDAAAETPILMDGRKSLPQLSHCVFHSFVSPFSLRYILQSATGNFLGKKQNWLSRPFFIVPESFVRVGKQTAKLRRKRGDLLHRHCCLIPRVQSIQAVDLVWAQHELPESHRVESHISVPESLLVNEDIPHLHPVRVFAHYCAQLSRLHVG